MRAVDLHVHYNRSDGTFSPTQLVDYAMEKGLAASLTWNFSGGKQVDVNVVDGIQDYRETKDNR